MSDLVLVNLRNRRDIEKGAIFVRMPELGLGYLRQYLEKKGFVVELHDEHIHGEFQPIQGQVLGFSLYGQNDLENLERIRTWKTHIPSLSIILGGSSIGHTLRERPNFVDYMVENTGYGPLERILIGLEPRGHLFGERRELDFPLEFRELNKYNSAAILCSFSCIYRCGFCLSSRLKPFQIRKKENVFQELDQILNIPSITYFEFFDNILSIIPYLEDLLRKIVGRKMWGCVTDARHPQLGTIQRMVSAGLTTLGLGVESLNDQTLLALNKCQTAEDTLVYLGDICSIDELRVHAFLMYGLPYQTKLDALEDWETLDLLGIPSQATHLRVIYGTSLWDKKDEYGFVLNAHGQVQRTNWMREDELAELDSIFGNKNQQSVQRIWGDLQ